MYIHHKILNLILIQFIYNPKGQSEEFKYELIGVWH